MSLETLNKPSLIFYAAWWPTEEHPYQGVFIQEHAKCLSKDFNIHVVYVEVKKTQGTLVPKTSIQINKNDDFVEYIVEIRTNLRRFGIHDYLVKRAFDSVTRQILSSNKPIGYCINVRDHITKLIPGISDLREFKFIHIEHFTYYHRGFHLLPDSEKSVERRALKNWFSNPKLSAVLPVSRDLKDTMQGEFGANPNIVNVIPNVASRVFEYQPKKEKPGEINIVCFASWSYPKRPKLLFEALHLLDQEISSQVSLNFIGDGPSLEEAKMFNNSQKHPIKTSYHGFQDKKYISELCQIADFMVHPTDAENAPTCISEALCCGTPVISMQINGIPEMINNDNGILVPADDKSELAVGIRTMIANLNDYDRQSIAHTAQKIYHPEAVSKRLTPYLNSLSSE